MKPRVDFTRDVYSILGLPFDALTLAQAVARVRAAAHAREPLLLSTANLNFTVMAQQDSAFRHSIVHSELCVADGMPIVWIARCLGLPITERVSGADIFEALRAGPAPAVKTYFFGGPDGAAQAACERVNETSVGIACVGHESPGFVPIEQMSSPAQLASINRSGAEFVVVSLGAKKGQAWIERNRSLLEAGVISHLGAVVNFAAGSVERAPAWLRRIGLEWTWRIKEEPTLWRRYWNDAMTVGGMLVRDLLPLWWQQWRIRSRRATAQAPVVRSERAGAAVRIILEGTFRAADTASLRQAFADAAHAGADVELELAGVHQVDSATVALIQLLAAHQADIGRRLLLREPSAALRRQLRSYRVDSLLGDDGRSRPGES
jgi:N-acetylglucosaminyldiphosphoundecaprenol N-acetyl-beta-D-mannosaminyltransferase